MARSVYSVLFYLVVIGCVSALWFHHDPDVVVPVFLWLFGVCFVFNLIYGIGEKFGWWGSRVQALRKAHTFNPPNVHGNAGNASIKDAKRRGWV